MNTEKTNEDRAKEVGSADDFADCKMCLGMASRRASRMITRAFERRLRPLGIRAPQFSILTVLMLAGPATIGQFAEWLGVERTTLSRNLDLVEAKGWIKIEAGAEDARSRLVSITQEGRAAAQRALPAWREAQEAAKSALGEAGVQSLHKLARTPIA